MSNILSNSQHSKPDFIKVSLPGNLNAFKNDTIAGFVKNRELNDIKQQEKDRQLKDKIIRDIYQL